MLPCFGPLGIIQAKREMAGFGAVELQALLWAYAKVGGVNGGGRGWVNHGMG